MLSAHRSSYVQRYWTDLCRDSGQDIEIVKCEEGEPDPFKAQWSLYEYIPSDITF